MRGIVMVTVLLTPVATSAQLLPYPEGSRVRFATDSAPDWSYASVLDGTRTNLFVVTDISRRTLLLSFNERLQLQVRTGRAKGTMLLGLGAGLAVGATLGGTLLSDLFGTREPEQSRAQTAVVLGAVGALIGALVGSRLGPEVWVDLPVQSGYLPPAPLTLPDPEPASLRRVRHRWNRFEATEADFEAFFTIHKDSLRPIEGIWINNLVGDPLAIVRDSRFPGFEYVVVNLPRASRRSAARDGRILQVLRSMGAEGQYEMVVPGSGNPDQAFYQLVNDKLILRNRQEPFRAPVELVRRFRPEDSGPKT